MNCSGQMNDARKRFVVTHVIISLSNVCKDCCELSVVTFPYLTFNNCLHIDANKLE